MLVGAEAAIVEECEEREGVDPLAHLVTEQVVIVPGEQGDHDAAVVVDRRVAGDLERTGEQRTGLRQRTGARVSTRFGEPCEVARGQLVEELSAGHLNAGAIEPGGSGSVDARSRQMRQLVDNVPEDPMAYLVDEHERAAAKVVVEDDPTHETADVAGRDGLKDRPAGARRGSRVVLVERNPEPGPRRLDANKGPLVQAIERERRGPGVGGSVVVHHDSQQLRGGGTHAGGVGEQLEAGIGHGSSYDDRSLGARSRRISGTGWPQATHAVVRGAGSDYGALVPFDAILGQPAAVGTLTQSLRSGRVHHALRFEGPDGVGKEMAAMALAQALVCSAGDPLGCGRCSACQRAVTFGEGTPAVPVHPDIILVERGLYPPEAIGRRSPELQEISVDQVRTVVLEHASFPPHEGKARVFIIRRAEELSVSAANSLLKTLEEPGQGTHFILLVSRPARLLSTIQSRTLRVRFAPLPDAVIVQVLVQRGIAPDQAKQAASLAAGSASTALALVDADATREREAFVDAAIAALRKPDMSVALQLAEARARDKRALRDHLEALAAYFASQGREAAQHDDMRALRDSARYQIVLQAMRELERNAAPALLIENMMMRLRAEER